MAPTSGVAIDTPEPTTSLKPAPAAIVSERETSTLPTTVKVPSTGGIPPPQPRRFTDKHEERRYLKGRLALAFRIFAKRGYDEG